MSHLADGVAATDAAAFDLDLRAIEAEHSIARLVCDTSDGCGASCGPDERSTHQFTKDSP